MLQCSTTIVLATHKAHNTLGLSTGWRHHSVPTVPVVVKSMTHNWLSSQTIHFAYSRYRIMKKGRGVAGGVNLFYFKSRQVIYQIEGHREGN